MEELTIVVQLQQQMALERYECHRLIKQLLETLRGVLEDEATGDVFEYGEDGL